MDDLRTVVPKKCVRFYNMGTDCSEFRIPSGTNWSLMVDLGTILPNDAFLLITRERVFIRIQNKNGPLLLKEELIFRVPNPERNKLDLNR